ncbi:DUF551 domain-containing protein [Escherichia coli]|uniref:DUF551 domain-containing protein n=1 Tax=Escherichia coli TaxID=562 RepID=UPI0039088C08
MTTITKERIELFIKNPLENGLTRGEQMELARIALASLEAEPVAYIFKHPAGKLFWALTDESNKEQPDVIPVYADSPAPVVPDEIDVNDVPRAVTYFKTHRDCYADGWNACRAAMLQSGNFRENKNSSTNNFREIAETSTNYPVIPDGLSTVCAEAYQVVGVMADALGVFGDAAVQKVLDNLSQQKLVHRDVLPFSLPVTPDGWISCSDRMPEKNQNVLISVNFDSSLVEPLICSARYTGSTFRRGDATIKSGNGIEQATHWMPLPEPPKEA